MKKITIYLAIFVFLISLAAAAGNGMNDSGNAEVEPVLYAMADGATNNGTPGGPGEMGEPNNDPEMMPPPELDGEKPIKGEPIAEPQRIQEREQAMNGSGPVLSMNGTQVHAGLYNALQNVENENARMALERNMNRFLEKYQKRFQNASVEIDADKDIKYNEETGELNVKVKEPVKYLGFIKGKATTQFDVGNDGAVTEKKPWYRFMYSEGTSQE